jgi:hypothetical protein
LKEIRSEGHFQTISLGGPVTPSAAETTTREEPESGGDKEVEGITMNRTSEVNL